MKWFCETCKTSDDVYTILVKWKNGDKDLSISCTQCFLESRYCVEKKLWELIEEIICEPLGGAGHGWTGSNPIGDES